MTVPGSRRQRSVGVGQASALGSLQRLANGSPQLVQVAQMQSLADARTGPAQLPIQRAENVWHDSEERDITQVLASLPGDPSPEVKADALIGSDAPVLSYGREPATDEQVEITGGASYLKKRKDDWKAELEARDDPDPHVPVPQSWETYQEKIQALSPGAPGDPWFLNQNWGYKATDRTNTDWIQDARSALEVPDRQDPQQILGKTYDRDTDLTSRSDWARTQGQTVGSGTTGGDFAGRVGSILRIFDSPSQMQASKELRLTITSADVVQFTDRFEIVGQVIATPHFPNGGFGAGTRVRCVQNGGGGISIYRVLQPNDQHVATWLPSGWSGKLESQAIYNAVTVAEDSLGIRFQSGDPLKARNRSQGAELNDATVTDLRGRYGNSPHGTPRDKDLSLEHTLGPSRNRLNIEDLGWDVSVAKYRRLGGDVIFNEANHPAAVPANYGNTIEPAANVDVTNPDWYYDSQQDRPDRFVGGRSNSTFLYLKTASVLYQRGDLSVEDCLDVMAFAVADMVVSGEHSLPECMTTIVMAAQNSPPWNTTALNIGGPTAAFATWKMMINAGTVGAMRATTRSSLAAQLDVVGKDFKLLKVLAILGKVLR